MVSVMSLSLLRYKYHAKALSIVFSSCAKLISSSQIPSIPLIISLVPVALIVETGSETSHWFLSALSNLIEYAILPSGVEVTVDHSAKDAKEKTRESPLTFVSFGLNLKRSAVLLRIQESAKCMRK